MVDRVHVGGPSRAGAAGAPADAPTAPPRPAPRAPQDPRWRTALQRVLREPRRLAVQAQPIAELTSGSIAGYELLARFDGTADGIIAPPDRWFVAADHWGCGTQLQAAALRAGLAVREVLPADTFLTVNVDPHALLEEAVAAVLLDRGDLTRVVVEVTERTRAGDQTLLLERLAALRRRGALVAVDDAGAGYAGLAQLLSVRPEIIKLDRELVTGLDADPVKRALVEVLGDLASRLDAWLLAEGVETSNELEAVVRLGVPLGQGWALARPASGLLGELPDGVVEHIRTTAARASFADHVAGITSPARTGTDASDGTGVDVLLGDDGRPRAVRWGTGGHGPPQWSPAMVVAPSAALVEVARRAAARPERDAGAPLVCTDGSGRVVGLVTTADLLVALAAR